MKRFLLLLAVGMLMTSQADAAIFNAATGHWYDIVSSGANGSWDNAEAAAVAGGGHLVTVNDAAEQTWLVANFGGGGIRSWIGFNDVATEGTWVWSRGETPGYTNWDSGEPNNMSPPDGIGEDYGVINWDTGTGEWNDWSHLRPDYASNGPIDGIAEYDRDPGPVVPEPSAVIIWSLLGTFGVAMGWYRRRRAA